MADEKPKDDKPKGDSKPKTEEKAPEQKNPGREIVELLFFFFIITTLLGGVFASATNFLSGDFSKKISVEGLLGSYTRPFPAVLNPLGGRALVARESTKVFNAPGGDEIGTQKQRAEGKVTEGSVEVNSVRYWYIDFDKGVDGWVQEDALRYIKPGSKASLFSAFLLKLLGIVFWVRLFLWLVAIILLVAVVYVIYNLGQVRNNTRLKLYSSPEEAKITPVSLNKNWDRVLSYVESQNESEWRLAVIEADIMLSELLNTMNLGGDSIGEKLKGIEKSDFNTLDLAWEAHKIRNQIAHDPSFMLTQREAKRVIGLFEAVFKEFAFV
ncbi:MAG: hypothetical protein NTV02_00365 [Candidatus Zambryskibacteria bacterium]|nr:hypothetical protein [Candidatus Zambryskibacteria bacterium]